MDNNDPKPENQPAGNNPPPRPPCGTTVGLGPEDDGPNKNRLATITKAADGEGKFIREAGGRNNYGHVKVKVEPNGRGQGIVILNDVLPSAIPAEYIASVTQGVRDALGGVSITGSPFDGCRVTDIIVRAVDGSFHPTDSNKLAFTLAALSATSNAIKHASPLLIE